MIIVQLIVTKIFNRSTDTVVTYLCSCERKNGARHFWSMHV